MLNLDSGGQAGDGGVGDGSYWKSLGMTPQQYEPAIYWSDLEGTALLNAWRPVTVLNDIENLAQKIGECESLREQRVLLGEICRKFDWSNGVLPAELKDFTNALQIGESMAPAHWELVGGIVQVSADVMLPAYRAIGDPGSESELTDLLIDLSRSLEDHNSPHAGAMVKMISGTVTR